MKKLILAMVASIAAVGAAQAQTDGAYAPYAAGFTPHAYVGVGAATAKNQLTDDYRVSPKIFGGYEYTPNWGVEAGYTRFGEENGSALVPNNQVAPYKVKGNSTYVAGKYQIPLGERFSGYGKVGVEHSERTNEITGYNRWTDRDTGLYGGVGVQYDLNRNLAVTAEYERYGKDKSTGAKADMYTVGLKYGF
jgi:OOP family OmpA-OmpF porin